MNAGKVAISLIVGAAIGAAIGVLFAPAKGAALRRKIHRMGEKEVDVLKDKYNEFSENMSKKYEKVKEDISDFAKEKMNKAEQKVKAAENN
jgi:gas vesicle protein